MGHYFTLVDQPNDAIFVIFDRKFEFINHRFEELFGVTMDEVCSPDFNPIDLIAPESRKLALEHIQKGYGGNFHPASLNLPASLKMAERLNAKQLSCLYLTNGE